MTRPGELGSLKTSEWQRLQDLTDRFENAWQQADSVDLGVFLPPAGDPLRNVALFELIKSDLEIRWRHGQIIGLEFYLDRFPELGDAEHFPVELIFEEYRVRQLYGDKPELATYRTRFRDQYAALKRLADANPLRPPVAKPAPPLPAAVVPQADTKKTTVLSVGDEGYKLLNKLGRGSFGEVFQAEAPGGIEVAVKIINRNMDPREAEREGQAIETIKRLRHPLLLQIQAFWVLDDKLVIVMELADGNLRDRLRECRQAGQTGIPLGELISYFRETAEALDYLHSEKVQHRDVKPDNILLLKRHAKLADFGLARVLESHGMMTATSSGTPPYMAPEIWRGHITPHSDQYSLAASYAELRLTRRLYPDREIMQIMLGRIHREPELDPLPTAEQQVLRKALSRDPDARYLSCQDFVQALEYALRSELKKSGEHGRRSGIHAAKAPAEDDSAVVASPDAGTVTSSKTKPPEPIPHLPTTRSPASWRGPDAQADEKNWLAKNPGIVALAAVGILVLAAVLSVWLVFRPW